MPVSVGQSLTNIGQILEHDYVAIVCNRFVNDPVRNRVDILFAPCSFAVEVRIDDFGVMGDQ